MIRDEVLNMPAGSEMDALVAEKVMGWVLHPHKTHWMLWDGYPDPTMRLIFRNYADFDPSSCISDAWEVVEKMQQLHEGWRFSIIGGDKTMGYTKDTFGNFKRNSKDELIVNEQSRLYFGWHAEFFGESDPRLDYGQRHGEARAPTAPLAICRAALLAVCENE